MENNLFVRFWIHSSMRNFHVSLAVIAVASYVIGGISHNPSLTVVSDVVTLFGIIHYFIHGYFHRQHIFLTNNMKVYSLPKKKIARTGSFFLAFFMLMVCIGMTIVRELYQGTLIAKLKMLVLFVISKVLTALFGTDGLGREEHIVQNNFDLIGSMNNIAAKSESPWENVINAVQTMLIIIGVILMIVLIIMAIVNYVRRLIGKAGLNVKKTVGKETADREESLWASTAKREKLLDFSPTAKIRRIYRRSINRQRKKGQIVPDWMTPAEIENHVSMPAEEQYRQLHEIYEKARYSESGANDDDARRIKKLDV